MDLFEPLKAKLHNCDYVCTAVANPIDEVSLGGAVESFQAGIIKPILYGSQIEIEAVAQQYGFDISQLEIVNCADETTAIAKAVEACHQGKAKILMKGKVHTAHLMQAVVNKTTGLRTDSQVSHVFALSIPTYHKLLFITDAAINISPNVEQKAKILLNAINFLKALGITKPKVACLSAVEVAHPKILGSLDALALSQNSALQKEAIIEGPLAFDNAINKHSAEIKGINSKVAGDVDLLLMPNLESGNILFKSLVYLSNAQIAGVVLGAKIPIILTSRADNTYARLLSTVLARLA